MPKYHRKYEDRSIPAFRCNMGLAGFKDSIQIMKKAIIYIKKNSKRTK